MQAFILDMLSPLFFIKKRKNEDGRWNKFYHTNGKFFCYKYRNRYFFFSKGKVYGSRSIPGNLEDGIKGSFITADKNVYYDSRNNNDYSSVWNVKRILEWMGCDVVFKQHGIPVSGEIEYKTWENIVKKEPASMRGIYCPTYMVSGNNHDKVALSPGMIFNWDGSLNGETQKNEHHKYEQKMLNAYLNEMRLRTNRMAKARRIDNKVVRAVETAELNGDWSAINASDTFSIRNVSTRRKMLTQFSVEEIVKAMDPETVDTAELNNSKYELIRFPQTIDENEPFTHCYYLRMLNVSTGETHLEGVAPYIKDNTQTWGAFSKDKTLYAPTVHAALAWRDRDQEGDSAKFRNDPMRPRSTKINEFDNAVKAYNQPVALS